MLVKLLQPQPTMFNPIEYALGNPRSALQSNKPTHAVKILPINVSPAQHLHQHDSTLFIIKRSVSRQKSSRTIASWIMQTMQSALYLRLSIFKLQYLGFLDQMLLRRRAKISLSSLTFLSGWAMINTRHLWNLTSDDTALCSLQAMLDD